MSYSGGPFACFSDINICLYGIFCTPCQNGRNHAKIRQEECTICHCINPIAEYWIRKELEKKNGEDGNDVTDCLIGCICMPCAVCQDARNLQ